MATHPTPRAGRDILAILHDDHQAIDTCFARYAEARDGSDKRRVIEDICLQLLPHAEAEEEIFYRAIADAEADADEVDAAAAEHAAARKTLESILACSTDDPTYDMKVRMLQREIQHHVREEETELFEEAREAGLDLEALAEQFLARKAELTRQAEQRLREGRTDQGPPCPTVSLE